MADKPENPPAFPVAFDHIGKNDGMSLRDYFAGAVLQGMAVGVNPSVRRINSSEEKCTAEQAYNYADAMLEARQK